jgi:hypothetical protein
MTLTYILVSLVGGILFGLMDGFINANPLAVRLYAAYRPIARTSINAPAALVIDLAYGFIMAAIFLLLYRSLPGGVGIAKGLSFGLLVWFFRVVMNVASQWVMFTIPVPGLLYMAAAGLVEMLLLGVLFGLTLRPAF